MTHLHMLRTHTGISFDWSRMVDLIDRKKTDYFDTIKMQELVITGINTIRTKESNSNFVQIERRKYVNDDYFYKAIIDKVTLFDDFVPIDILMVAGSKYGPNNEFRVFDSLIKTIHPEHSIYIARPETGGYVPEYVYEPYRKLGAQVFERREVSAIARSLESVIFND